MDDDARDGLLEIVYEELRRIAAYQLGGERRGHTLQPTALVHEAFLRLAAQSAVDPENRAQFVALAASMMRRILIDYARARNREKRGGPLHQRVDLDDVAIAVEGSATDVLAIDEALSRLAAFDPIQARVIELRYFGGLSVEETAAALDLSPATIKRHTAFARAWLQRELDRNP